MDREEAERLGWHVDLISDSDGSDYVYYYFVLVRPDGEVIEIGDEESDYGWGWGDDTAEDAWSRLPEGFANKELPDEP